MMDISIKDIRKGLENPTDALNYIQTRLIAHPYLRCRQANQWFHSRYFSVGDLDVIAEDWDTLILLDACRFDVFSDICTLDGGLERRQSPGSMSLEFIQSSFNGRELHDTVYVSGNPYTPEIEENVFYDVWNMTDDYWDGDLNTVLPTDMTKATLEAHNNYPNKRIIAHFMQPHEPFLSDFGKSLSKRLYWKGNQYFLSGASVSDL